MNEQKRSVIESVVALCRKEQSFDQELRRRLGFPPSVLDQSVDAIRQSMSLRTSPSIDYGFFPDPRVGDLLLVDNILMENASLDFMEESDRYDYCLSCIYAFYQMEAMVNCYVSHTSPGLASKSIWSKVKETCGPLSIDSGRRNIFYQLSNIHKFGIDRCLDIYEKGPTSGDSIDEVSERFVSSFMHDRSLDDVRSALGLLAARLSQHLSTKGK